MSGRLDAQPGGVAAVLTLDLRPRATALFAADLHLCGKPSPAVAHLTGAIASLPPGSVVLLGGDVLELLDGPDQVDPSELLAAEQALVAGLCAAAGRGVRVVWLVGNHDIRLARDAAAQARVAALARCEFALAADVGLATGAGTQRVWFEHGNQANPYTRFTDPGHSADTPLGEHVVREVLPVLRSVAGAWVDDAAALTAPASFPAFVTSRMLYRRLLPAWPWALAALGGVFLLWLAGTVLLGEAATSTALLRGLANLAALALLDAALLAVAAIAWTRRTAARLGVASGLLGGREPNGALAAALRDRHPHHVGLVTGHTHIPQLSDVDGGFYANPGASCPVVRPVPTLSWTPPVFRRTHDVGWIQVGGGPDGIHAELHHAALADPTGQTWVERWLARRHRHQTAPTRIAAWPEGPTTVQVPIRRPVRAVRRAAAAAVAASGLISLASALSPPLAGRLRLLADLLPLEVSLTANELTVAVGVVLIGLAVGLARGQRRAHRLAVAALAVATASHLVKGVDVEEAVVTGAALAWLLAVRDRFRLRGPASPPGRQLALLGAAVAAGVAIGTVVLAAAAALPLATALWRVLGWLVLLGPAPVGRAQRFIEAGTDALGLAGVLAGLLVVVARARHSASAERARVRARVLARGTDSLAYFALRDDKQHFLIGDSVVAYAVFGRVALVSPDPIGPPNDLERALGAFRAFAAEQGWITAILAAAPGTAERYRGLGLRPLYLGDEAVVRFDRLHLRGNRHKALRGACNRAARAGYTVAFLDPARLTPQQRAPLAAMAAASRRGQAERGFSMTLGRLFDPGDTGLLLAVAYDPAGQPGAFCQFVPAADVGGWSLDVMRRLPDVPNGLMDFLLISTMRHLAGQGATGMGLNFATMRSVLDPGALPADGRSWVAGLERRVLHSLSQTFQIESLWQFNAKYDPRWRPRYLVYEHPAHLPEIAAAVARAESFWELPLVGRLLRPRPPTADGPAEADAAASSVGGRRP
jgi:lysylphosphatidylglycerol synthetase-like protein (DUF2156 family)/UDP-2,3-diacylglucosamine pyrophosphatase LpxH